MGVFKYFSALFVNQLYRLRVQTMSLGGRQSPNVKRGQKGRGQGHVIP